MPACGGNLTMQPWVSDVGRQVQSGPPLIIASLGIGVGGKQEFDDPRVPPFRSAMQGNSQAQAKLA